jgi:cytochrome c5
MAALPPAGLTPDALPDPASPGAQALLRYCTACHALPSPAIHSATDWPAVVRRMWLRIDRVSGEFGVPVPNTAERAVLLPYLLEHALKVGDAELPAGPGREEFRATCSRCHELPDPRQHSPVDWVAVARRMNQHMEDMLGRTINREDFTRIVRYLETASAPRGS